MKERHRDLLIAVLMGAFGFVCVAFRIYFRDESGLAVTGAFVCFVFPVIYLIRGWIRKFPFRANTGEYPWQRSNADPLAVWVEIPRTDHDKGPEPKLRIVNHHLQCPRIDFDFRPNENGDVLLFYPRNVIPANGVEACLELEITG